MKAAEQYFAVVSSIGDGGFSAFLRNCAQTEPSPILLFILWHHEWPPSPPKQPPNGYPHPQNNPRMATFTPQTTPEWLPSPPKQPPNGYPHPPNNPRMATFTPQTTPEWLPSPPKQPPNGFTHHQTAP